MVKKKESAVVGSSCGLTVMLGGFQSARVDCWMAFPSAAEASQGTYRRCRDFAYEKVMDEVMKLHRANQGIKGSIK